MEPLKLTTIYLQSLHQAEFGQFIIRLFEDFEKIQLKTDTDADLKKLLEELKAKIPTYNRALEQIKASEESAKIAKLDKIRDADIQALKDSIKPYRNAKTTAQKEAYDSIKIVLDSYKNIINEAYEKETHMINSLVTTLQDEKYKSAVQALKIGDFIKELEKSNQAFNDLFAHRSYQILQKETFDVKAIRGEMAEIYRKISNYILTMAEIKQEDFYKKALEVINNSRKYYATVLSARAGQNAKNKPTEETPK